MERDSKRILIVGAGAVGGYVGAYFARDGEDVTLVDPWPEHVEHMRGQGITLSGTTDAECFTTAPVNALHLTELQSCAGGPGFDIAFVCVKSYDTAWATQLACGYLADGGFVVSLQNCMNEETIASVAGWGRTTGCIASSISVELTAPGTIRRLVARGGDKHTVFRVGEVHGRITPRIEHVAKMLASIDSSKATPNLWGERWSKLILNGMRNGVSAASGLSNNEMDREPITRRLSIRLAAETISVGLAHGFALEPVRKLPPERWVAAAGGNNEAMDEIETLIVANTEGRIEGGRPSMGQDVQKGRRTEIEFMNGLIAAKGAEIGIATPACLGLVEAVKRVERGEAAPALDNVSGI